MNKIRLLVFFWVGALVCTAANESRTAAVFVSNRAGEEYESQLPVLEDLMTAKLTDLGFQFVSRDFVTAAVRQSDGSQVEDPMVDQSSALNLAQSMGADYILAASITSVSKQKRNINAYGVQLSNYTYTMRLSYKVLDAGSGGSLTGGVVTATKEEQNTVNSNVGFNVVAPDPSTPAAPAGSAAANADDALMRIAQQYQKAVGMVLNETPKGGFVGTVWGVGPNAFATNAHVGEDSQAALNAGRPPVITINKNPDLKFRVTKVIMHPRYGSQGDLPINDVAILEVEGRLPVWFPVASESELRRVDSGYRVAYLGFPSGENMTRADPSNPVATMQTGIVTSVTNWKGTGGGYETLLLVQHNLSSTGGASGSPVFNPKGQVIALHNAGNYGVGKTWQGDKLVEGRVKSGLQIGYAQRADLLADIYSASGGGRGASGGAGAAAATPAKPVLVAFLDPDLEPIIADLLDDATTQIASALKAKLASNRIAATAPKAGPVNITLNVETADLYIPDVRLGPENTVSIKDGKNAIAPLNVSVEINGVTVGSAPGKLSVRSGLSKIRLTREGYLPWERTINAVEGQTLTIAMQMSPAGLKRWQELTVFMNNLKNGAKLTDAEVEVLQGQAQKLRQSGFKVDTKDAPAINITPDRPLFPW